MHTSLVLFALSGVFAPTAALDRGPKWLDDYSLARTQCVSENKPLAVFIGSGKSGWNNVSKEGELDQDVRKLLAEQYICVYIDRTDTDGWRLAHAFEMTHGAGLIISSRKAQTQAFRHEGDLEAGDLGRFLKRFSDPNRVVSHTETYSQGRVSNYYNPDAASGSGGYQPSFSGGGGRSC